MLSRNHYTRESQGRSFRVLALLQGPAGVPKPLLSRLGIDSVSEVRIVESLSAWGLQGTPSVLIVDPSGILKAAWTGKLTQSQAKEVCAALGVRGTPPPESVLGSSDRDLTASGDNTKPSMAPSELRSLLGKDATIVVDIRPRVAFQRGHITGSLNIPLDELPARAWHELPIGEQIIVYCHLPQKCAVEAKTRTKDDLCGVSQTIFSYFELL